MKMQSVSSKSRSFSAIALVVLMVSVMCVEVAAGRYLPTRSDDSRRDRIKDILRIVSMTNVCPF